MTRYYFAAFLLCMMGMVAAFAFDRPLSAVLFQLGALCFAVRVLWELRRPKAMTVEQQAADMLEAGWHSKVNLNTGGLIILPPGATLEGVQRSYPQ